MPRCAQRAFYVEGIKVYSGTATWVDPQGQTWVIVAHQPRENTPAQPQSSYKYHLPRATPPGPELHYRELPDGAVLQLVGVPDSGMTGLPSAAHDQTEALSWFWLGQDPDSYAGLPGLVFRADQARGRAGQRSLALDALRARCTDRQQYGQLLTAAALQLAASETWSAQDRELARAWLTQLDALPVTPRQEFQLRALCFDTLVRLDPSAVRGPLLALARHQNVTVRGRVLEELRPRVVARMDPEVLREVVHQLAGDPVPEVRISVPGQLERLGPRLGAETLEELTYMLAADMEVRIRGRLVEALGGIAPMLEDGTTDALVRELAADGHPTMQLAVVGSLARLSPHLERSTVTELATELASHSMPGVYSRVGDALPGIAQAVDGALVLEMLPALLRSPHPGARMHVVSGLGQAAKHMTPGTLDPVLMELAGVNGPVDPYHLLATHRINVAELVASAAAHLEQDTLETLVPQLARDTAPGVRAAIARGLGTTGAHLSYATGRAVLTQLSCDADDLVAEQVAASLDEMQWLGGEDLAQAALVLSGHHTASVRQNVARTMRYPGHALDERLDGSAMVALWCSLISHDADGSVLTELVVFQRHRRDKAILDAVLDQCGRHPDPAVRASFIAAFPVMMEEWARQNAAGAAHSDELAGGELEGGDPGRDEVVGGGDAAGAPDCPPRERRSWA